MHAIEVSTPTHGAAYQVLYETVHPVYCNSYERLAEIQTYFRKVAEWAETQPDDVRAAYTWAMKSMVDGINARLRADDLGNRVIQAVATIPRPDLPE